MGVNLNPIMWDSVYKVGLLYHGHIKSSYPYVINTNVFTPVPFISYLKMSAALPHPHPWLWHLT